MLNSTRIDWDEKTYGEIDHLKMTPPFIRLSHKIDTPMGDSVCLYDLRCKKPSIERIHPRVLHSVEHILIEGFRHFFSEKFINAAPMGCQTGFYIILIGSLRPAEMLKLLESIFIRSLKLEKVPYQEENSCGQPSFHNIEEAQSFIKELLNDKDSWLNILD